MRKKQREIIVNGEPYVYTIKNNVDGDGSNRARIISVKTKKLIEHFFDYSIQITPKTIESLILQERIFA